MSWDMSRLINESLVSYFQAQVDYTCLKDSPRSFWSHIWKVRVEAIFGIYFPFCF